MMERSDTRVNWPDLGRIHYHPCMRDKMKAVATELFIRHGLANLTLGAVADQIGISRPSIHYHFHTKSKLAEEVLEDYARVNLDHSRSIWLDPKISLQEKFDASLEFSRRRYLRYNPSGKGDRPWSLFARFYQESDLMTPQMIACMKNAAREQQAYFGVAVEVAVLRGELVQGAPAADIGLQLAAMVNQLGWLTWSSSSFAPVEQLYGVTLRHLQSAFGAQPQASPPPRPVQRSGPARVAAKAGSQAGGRT
jgi:TetR/AcrR family transcriptional regulator, transcriptional repressor for nem operon